MHKKTFRISLLLLLLSAVIAHAEISSRIILIHPFENLGDKKDSWLSLGIADSITSDIVFIRELQAITEKDRRAVIRQIELSQAGLHGDTIMEAAGALLGADLILTGNYLISGDKVSIKARLIALPAGNIENSITVEGNIKDIFQLQNAIVKKLFNFKLTRKIRKLIALKPTADLEAYKLYSLGLKERHKNPRLAYGYYVKAISRDANYINALIQAGQTAALSLSLFNESMEYTKRARQVIEKIYGKDNLKYAQVLIALANVYYKKQNYRASLKYNLDALKVLKKIRRKNHIFYKDALHNAALSYSDIKHYKQAISYYKKAINWYHEHKKRVNYSYINMLINIAVLHKNTRRFSKALDILSKAKKYAEQLKLQNTMLYGGILANTAIVYKNLRRYSEALPLYHKALKILERLYLTRTSEYAGTLFNIGNIYYEQGNRAEATKYYKRAYALFKELGLHKIARRVRKMY